MTRTSWSWKTNQERNGIDRCHCAIHPGLGRSSRLDSTLLLPASQLLCFSSVHTALYPIICHPILHLVTSLGASLCHMERSCPKAPVTRKLCFLHQIWRLSFILPSSYWPFASSALHSAAFSCLPPPSPDPGHYSQEHRHYGEQ